jgi:hypothetical protein
MADKKISALTGATTPLAGTEVLPIVQSGATVKVAVSDLTAGRAVAATSIQFGSGSVLSAYETGTWTPNQGSGLTVVGTFYSNGSYTKVGRLVTVNLRMFADTSISVSAGGTLCSNLPFTTLNDAVGNFGVGLNNATSATILINGVSNSTNLNYVGPAASTATGGFGFGFYMTLTYQAAS